MTTTLQVPTPAQDPASRLLWTLRDGWTITAAS
jgi:hypothetical protein